MRQVHKRFFQAIIACSVVLAFCAFVLPLRANRTTEADTYDVVPMAMPIDNSGACIMGQDYGIYLCRPENSNAENIHSSSVDTSVLRAGKNNFNPEVHAYRLKDNQWSQRELIPDGDKTTFWVDYNFEENSTKKSIVWHLRETAPSAVYCIGCFYKENEDDSNLAEACFRVVYTGDWTYTSVSSINTITHELETQKKNWSGGESNPLYLRVTFNDGATKADIADGSKKIEGKNVLYGAINNEGDIVSLESMFDNITVRTLSGEIYKNFKKRIEVDPDYGNCVRLTFPEKLGNEIYLVQFTSTADDRIIGQFIIDNTGAKGGVNLSDFWAVLMIVGGVLAFGAASFYLVPFIIVKVNEARVYKESERVDRMKNPEKYAESDKKSLKGAISKIIYNIKTPAYKRKQDKQRQEEEQKPVEEKVYSNRFTEMLRERQEKRDFMREHNVTSEEMEKIKESEEIAKKEEADSFAALRDDDDDEIATFHAAEDEISTLETGSYVKDGTTFAKLDSMRDEAPKDENGNKDGGN